jgi:serine/threonine protein kinase
MSTTTDSISVQAAKEHTLPELKPGQVVAGRFEILSRIGEGMLGAVYKVKHTKTGETLAVKFLRPRLLKSGVTADAFGQEIRLAGRLKHPGIVQYHEAGEHEGLVWCSMDWVDGQSLRDWLAEFKAKGEDPPGRDVQDILVQVLEALVFAHAATPPAIHEDLKPENILITAEKGPDGKPRRRARVTDFAIARIVNPAVFEGALNREGAFYMAPEVTGFGGRVAPNMDTYSVGAIFYEALTGQPPLGSWQMPTELRPKELTQAVDDMVGIALSPDSQDRFQTARDMLDAMKAMTSGLGGEMDPRLRMVAMVLAGLVVVAILAGGGYLASLPSEEELRQEELQRRAGIKAELKAQAQEAAPSSSDLKYDDMIWIPGGQFVRGMWSKYDEGSGNERMEERVQVAGFWMDRQEAHTEKAEEPPPPEDPNAPPPPAPAPDPEELRPLRDMAYAEAEAHCDSKGKRLCTEDEWEKACKGPDNWIYAYDDEFNSKQCPPSGWKLRAYRVSEFQRCLSGYSIHNLGGGLLEWTSSKEGEGYVVKGGAVGNEQKGTRCAARSVLPPGTKQPHIGVRCCSN